jgi:uncharacterized membrane protein
VTPGAELTAFRSLWDTAGGAVMNLPPTSVVPRGLIEYTHSIYALQALSVLVGVLGVHSVALRFAFGLPSVIAVIMNYSRRHEAHGSWLESHFRWQIRTFWLVWLWLVVIFVFSMPLMLFFIGWLTALGGMALLGVWVIYRVIRGWLALRDGLPMPEPA